MANNTPPQPFIVQTAGKRSVMDYVFPVIIIGGGLYFGNKAWVKYKAGKEAGKLDTPATQAASKIYSAKHWYGDNPQIAFDTAREIALKKIPWKDVSDSFKNLSYGNIDEYLNFLSPEEKVQFFNIINLTQDEDTKFTGKPPAKSSLKYDVINNYCYAVTTKSTNIRKSPEIIGNGGITSLVGSSNIIAVPEINKPLGLMTGIYKLSKDGKTGFIEFYGQVWDSKGMQLKKVWVAASNIKITQFPKKTMEVQAKSYLKGTPFLRIDSLKYNLANS
ncbi:MAG: hypothetical protein Q7W13_13040 [Bacteroidia bacterium]|nr:hypothetical protein [Bacteroidia bacterium]